MSRASSKESSVVLEENLPNGVPSPELPAAGRGPASLGVSGDKPGSEKAKMDQVTPGEEAKKAATAVCNTVTVDMSVTVAPTPANSEVKWGPDEADTYLKGLGVSIETEVSFHISSLLNVVRLCFVVSKHRAQLNWSLWISMAPPVPVRRGRTRPKLPSTLATLSTRQGVGLLQPR